MKIKTSHTRTTDTSKNTTGYTPGNWPSGNQNTSTYQTNFSSQNKSSINNTFKTDAKAKNVPHLHISLKAMQKIWAWTDIADEEWSCLGYIHEETGFPSTFYVEDVYLVKQRNTAASTEMDAKDINRLMTELIREGKDTDKLRFWLHSHGSGTIFWSGTDEDTCRGFGENGYVVSAVVNQRREILARVDMYTPIRLTIDAIPVFYEFYNKNTIADLKEEYYEKANEHTNCYHKGQWWNYSELDEKQQEEAHDLDSTDKRFSDKRFQEMTEDEWEEFCMMEYSPSSSYLLDTPAQEEDISEESDFMVYEEFDCYGLAWEQDNEKCGHCPGEDFCMRQMRAMGRLDSSYNYTVRGMDDLEAFLNEHDIEDIPEYLQDLEEVND